MPGIGVGVSPSFVRLGGGGLPAGAYHNVNYLAENTTLNSTQIASATELGSVGGTMTTAATPVARYQPTADTIGGLQYADFSDVPSDGFRDYLEHDTAASAWPMGADSDDDFMVAALFLKDSGTQRGMLGTIGTITTSNAGFFIRQESNDTITAGMTPAGVAAWKGLASSGAISDGWRVVLCEWGSGGYAYYIDDMASAFASGSYTHGGGGGNASEPMQHGNPSIHGVTGLGHVVLYERKSADQAERELIRDALKATLGLS